jgi:hypothetical protein
MLELQVWQMWSCHFRRCFSQQWNPAKYAFQTTNKDCELHSYLTGLANDISLDKQPTIIKLVTDPPLPEVLFFCFGDIELRQTSDPNEDVRIVSPNEFALDGSYSLKLSENSRWQLLVDTFDLI